MISWIVLANLAGRKTQSITPSRYICFALISSASSQAARRDQNRIAQREFRLRKQQRVRCHPFDVKSRIAQILYKIRDLEARVEILSGGKDEALGEMRNILKGGFFCPSCSKYLSLAGQTSWPRTIPFAA